MLTGKCKESCEKWLEETMYRDSHPLTKLCLNNFYVLPFSMKIGVFEDFFDSVGLSINIESIKFHEWYYYVCPLKKYGSYQIEDNRRSSRQEARQAAIKKANEIFNEL